MTAQRPFKLFTGNANPELASKIAEGLGVHLGDCNSTAFSDGETRFELNENVRGIDVYVVQPTCAPANKNLMELLIMGDTFMRASARSVCAVLPYYGYARQDRKSAPRTPITAKLVADLISTAGYTRAITVDLHAGQIQGFFNFPVDHIFFGTPVALPFFKDRKLTGEGVTIVSPDVGGTVKARVLAKRLKCGLAIVDKRRDAPNKAKAMNLIGEVEGKVAILFDDIIDTAGTLSQAVGLLRDNGAKQVIACATHPVFSGPALERLNDAQFDEIIVSDTIPLREEAKTLKNLRILTMAPLIGETIQRIQTDDSVSALLGE